MWIKYFPAIILILFLLLFSFLINWEIVNSLNFISIWEYRVALWDGLKLTFLITIIATTLGFLLGVVFATLSQSPIFLLRWFIAGYVEIWRNTPLLVQLVWIHLALPLLTGVSTTAFQSGLIAMSLQASAYFTEIVRAGIQSVHRGQWEAAFALALPRWTLWTRIIIPPAIRTTIPPLANLSISLFKATSILAIISVDEFMTITTRVSNHALKPIEIFTFAALIYFIIGYAMSRGTLNLERYLEKSD